MSSSITVAAFYKYTALENLEEIKNSLFLIAKNLEIKGTILLAQDGINSTIAGDDQSIELFFKELLKIESFSDIKPKLSSNTAFPFKKLKIKIKPEILTFKEDDCNPGKNQTGVFVDSKSWNNLIQDKNVKLIDVRNNYEVEIGTFCNAINPKTETFTDFKEYIKNELDPKTDKKIAMFCTGGIRCEKASSYLIKQGFQEIYQLDGGILKYLEETKKEDSLWQGKCFIFDSRESLDHDLKGSAEI